MFNPIRINTITTLGASGPGGRLGRINVLTKAGAGGTLSVYDDTSAVAGSLLGVVDTTVNQSYVMDVTLKRGLFLAMAVAAADVSVSVA